MSWTFANGRGYGQRTGILQRIDLGDERRNQRRHLPYIVVLVRDLGRNVLHVGMFIRDALSQRTDRGRLLLKQSYVLLQRGAGFLQRGKMLPLGRLNI